MIELKKGLSSVAAAVIIATISISLVGTTYFLSRGMLESTTAEVFEVIDVFGNKLIIKNLGTQTITELKILVDGQQVDYSMDDIQPSKLGTVTIDTIGIDPGIHDLTIASKSMSQTFKWNFVYVEPGETTSTTTIVETTSTTTTTIITEGQSLELSMDIEQGIAEIGKPVKWSSKIEVNNPSDVEIKDYIVNILIPEDASNITIEDPVEDAVTEGEKSVKLSIAGKTSKSYFVDYETPAPYKMEEIDTRGGWRKTIKVKSDVFVHYKDVRVSSDIHENKTILRLYLIENNTRNDVTFDPSYNVSFIDSDLNGLVDTVKWIVPELSEKLFEITSGITPPRYYDNSTDTNYAGYPIEFSLRWTDDDGLSGFIFSIDQGNETFVNDSWIPWKDDNDVWGSQNLGPLDDGVNDGDATYNINNSDVNVNYTGNTTKYAVRLDVTTWKGLDDGDGIYCYHSNDGSTDWGLIGSCLAPTCLPSGVPYTKWINSTTLNLLDQIEHDGETQEWIHCNMIGIGGGENLVADVYVYFDYIEPIEAWSNITKTVNETAGAKIQWRVYANDTDNDWNYTEPPFSFKTIPYYGWLNITLITPDSSVYNESNPLKIPQKDTFNVNATIRCEGPGETCGPISGSVRYNESDPNMIILSTDEGAEPMWTLPKIEEDQYIDKDWNFLLGSEVNTPSGLAYNGTYFFVIDSILANRKIYRYNNDGSYDDSWLGVGYLDTSSDSMLLQGIYVNNTTIGVTDSADKVIFYDMNTGDYLDSFTASDATLATSLVFNKTYVWVLSSGIDNNKVYRYDLDSTLDGSFNVLVGEELFTPQGLEFNGTNWFIVDSTDDEVYAYDVDGNYLYWNFSVTSDVYGLTYHEEDYFYTLDADKYVRRYEKNVSGIGNPATLDTLNVGDFVQVNFTVNATTLGSYKIDVNASSENSQVQHNNSNHSVIKIVKVELSPNLLHPDPEEYTDTSPLKWTQNTTQLVTATIKCENGDCGSVVGTIRYNNSSSTPDTDINATRNAEPFYLTFYEPRSVVSACKPLANESESNTGFCSVPTWSYNPNKLCIDFLSTDAKLDGDVTNGDGGYDFYPDKKVSVYDSDLISGKLGKQCGDDGYEQMADVNNDCIINETDSDIVTRNNGYSGDYIYNLTGVYVTFDTDYKEYLDNNNCTWIPHNASNFTVYNSTDDLVGAMILFYTLNSSISCGSMNDGDTCQLKWTVNTTGNVSDAYKIGVQFNSTNLENKHTNNATVKIIDTGRLLVNLSDPIPDTINDITQNNTFNINASVECIDEYCGLVKATARYNNSGIDPDYSISTIKGSTPFYILLQDRPITYNYTGCCDQNLENAYDDGYNDTSTYARLLPSTEGESIRVNYTYSLGAATSAILYATSAYDTGYAPGIIQIYNFTSGTWVDWVIPNLVIPTKNGTLLDTSTGLINSTGHVILSAYAEYPNGGSQEYVALFDTYVYHTEDDNSQICHLDDGESCNLNWIVNTTGNLVNIYSIDVKFDSGLKWNDTNNSMIRIVETEKPKYWDPSTNSTYTGQPTEFRLRWTDNFGLSGYIFSLDNCTGEFENLTNTETNSIWVPMIGTGNWSNTTYVINSTGGCEIEWKFYTNDTFNNWNESSIYGFTTTSPYTWLNTTLIEPDPRLCNETYPCEKDKFISFVVNATVECKNEYCGEINGTIRYNSSQNGPDTPMGSGSGTPFYVVGDNTQSCTEILYGGDTCQLNWTVNVTGIDEVHKIDVNFTSSFGLENNTENAVIEIPPPPRLNITLSLPVPDTLSEWEQNAAHLVDATIECAEGICGNVNATVRYNSTGDEMVPVNTTEDTPFYIIDVERTYVPDEENKARKVSSVTEDNPNQASTEYTSTDYSNVETSNNQYVQTSAKESITAGCTGSCGCAGLGTLCDNDYDCLKPCTAQCPNLDNAQSGGTGGCTPGSPSGCSGSCGRLEEGHCGGGVCTCGASGSCSYTCNAGYYRCSGGGGCLDTSPCWIYTFQRYTFDLSSYINDVIGIKYCWEGNYSSTGGSSSANLKWYNVTNASWQTDKSISTNEDAYCTIFSGSNITDFYNSTSGLVQFVARGSQSRTGHNLNLYTDYVYLSIYTKENTFSCGSMSKGDTCQVKWMVNATGESQFVHKINVNSSSDLNLKNETRNATVRIIFPPYLDATLLTPSTTEINYIPLNDPFWLNTTVTCIGGYCGYVEGTARYGSTLPNKPINSTQGAKPFYVLEHVRPVSWTDTGVDDPENATDDGFNDTNTYANVNLGSTINYTYDLPDYVDNAIFYANYQGSGWYTIYLWNYNLNQWQDIEMCAQAGGCGFKYKSHTISKSNNLISSTGQVKFYVEPFDADVRLYDTYIYIPSIKSTLSCGDMYNDETCQLNWTIYATSDEPKIWLVDVNFNSTNSYVVDEDTDDASIKILKNEPPKYVEGSNSTNSTVAGKPIEFGLKWTDDYGLSNYMFSFDDCTGSFENDTFKSFEFNPETPDYTPKSCNQDGSATGSTCNLRKEYPGHATIDDCNDGPGDLNPWHVNNIFLNGTSFNASDAVNVTCEIKCYYYSGEYTKYGIAYNNGTGWRNIDYGVCPGGSNGKLKSFSKTFTTDNITGTHYVRCMADNFASTEGTCISSSPYDYHDNDDLDFTVISGPTIAWSNTTKVISSEPGCLFRWKVFANDSFNKWNISEEYSFNTLTPSEPSNVSFVQFNTTEFYYNYPINCSGIVKDPNGVLNAVYYKIYHVGNESNPEHTGELNLGSDCVGSSWWQGKTCSAIVPNVKGFKGNWNCSIIAEDPVFDNVTGYASEHAEMVNTPPTKPNITQPFNETRYNKYSPDHINISCVNTTSPADINEEDILGDNLNYTVRWSHYLSGWTDICTRYDNNNNCTWNTWQTVAEEFNYVYIKCNLDDIEDESEDSDLIYLEFDTTDPTCILNIPNSQILYSPHRLNGTYSDAYNVSNVTYQYYNTSTYTWDDIGTNSTANFTWVWDVNGGLEDITTLQMRVICNDTSGNSVMNTTSGIIVDTINQNPLVWNLWIRDYNDDIITKTGTGVNVHFTVNISDPDPAWNVSYIEGNFTLPNGTSVYKNFTISSSKPYTHNWTYTIPSTTDSSPPNATINVTVYDLGSLANTTNRSDLIIMETIFFGLTNDPVNFSTVAPGQKVEALPNRGWPLLAQLDGNVEIKLSQKAESDLYGLLDPFERIGIKNVTWNTNTSDESFSELVSNYYKIINETASPGYDQPIYYKLDVPPVGKQDYGGFLTIKGDKPSTPSCNSCSYPCTIKCNDPQSHWDEIPDGDSYYFTYTLDSESMVTITMTPDPTGDGGPDYDLYTSWTADECYQGMGDCGVPSGGDVEEICSPLSPLPAGTYYFQVEHWSDAGNGFYLELDCET